MTELYIFILSKIFSSEFQTHDSFYEADCRNSVFYLTNNLILRSTLNVLENILKDRDDVLEVKNIIINQTNFEVQKINQSVTELEMDVNKNHGKKILLFSQFFVESFGT